MLSAVIRSEHSYPTMPLAGQPVHQRSVHFGPLVLKMTPLKNPRLQQIGDQPVSRRSEPSSRNFLNGEQPYPWDLLQPRDKLSRHRCCIFLQLLAGSDYIFTLLIKGDGVLAFQLWKAPALFELSLYGVTTNLYRIDGMTYGVTRFQNLGKEDFLILTRQYFLSLFRLLSTPN